MKFKVGDVVKLIKLHPETPNNLKYHLGMIGVVCDAYPHARDFNYEVQLIGEEAGPVSTDATEMELLTTDSNMTTIKKYLGIPNE